MKFSKSKFVLTSTVALFIIGSLLVFALRTNTIQSPQRTEAKRYPHTHLPPSEWEPKRNVIESEHKLGDGETLASVARARYGHNKYSGVIKLYNHIADESAVKVGTNLRVPDMSLVLKNEGVTSVAPTEVELILCSRAKYDTVVGELWRLRTQRSDSYALPETIKQQLLEAADDLQQATDGLKTTKPNIKNAPARMIGQLEQSMLLMKSLAAGDHSDPNGYDIDMVQQRYALALTYAIIWAREGFN